MIGPIPTMIRKPKSGISTGGLSSGVKVSSQISLAVQLPEAMKPPSLGISIANRFSSRVSSGSAISTSLAGCCVFQRASIAANFAG